MYAGGASVALALLYEQYVRRIHINDLNIAVYSFWHAALYDTARLCRMIRDTEISMDEWYWQRAIQFASDPDPLELAHSTFFLNRTNRSGIIRGGVIGGKAQSGRWKLDARYNKTDLIHRIEKVARHQSQITLTNYDAAVLLGQVLASPPCASAVIYLDPPYFWKGGDLYQHSYSAENHAEIAGLVSQLDCPWIVSYDSADLILRLYEGCQRLQYTLSYSAQSRYRGNEAMFFSPLIQLRALTTGPACVPQSVVAKRKRALVAA